MKARLTTGSLLLLLPLGVLVTGSALAAPPAPTPAPATPPAAEEAPPAPPGVEAWAKFAGVERKTQTTDARVTVKGRTLVVDANTGSVFVKAGSGEEVALRARLEYASTDQEWMASAEKDFLIDVEEAEERVTVRPHAPPVKVSPDGDVQGAYALVLEVLAPRGTAVEIAHAHRAVEVADVGGAVTVSSSTADITVAGAVGAVSIDCSYGVVAATNITGPVSVKADDGDIELARVKGDVDAAAQKGELHVAEATGSVKAKVSAGSVLLTKVGGAVDLDVQQGNAQVIEATAGVRVLSGAGDTEVRTAKGPVDVRSARGAVEVHGAAGEVTVNSGTGEVRVRGAQKTVVVNNNLGDVRVDLVQGAVNIVTSGGAVMLSDLMGDADLRCSQCTIQADRLQALRITADNSSVDASEVAGVADIETSGAAVTVSRMKGALRVHNTKGGVTARNFVGAGLTARHEITVVQGDVEFGWPADEPLSFRLESKGGRVKSDIPGDERQQGEERSIEGARGEGAASVKITAGEGNITLKSE